MYLFVQYLFATPFLFFLSICSTKLTAGGVFVVLLFLASITESIINVLFI